MIAGKMNTRLQTVSRSNETVCFQFDREHLRSGDL